MYNVLGIVFYYEKMWKLKEKKTTYSTVQKSVFISTNFAIDFMTSTLLSQFPDT